MSLLSLGRREAWDRMAATVGSQRESARVLGARRTAGTNGATAHYDASGSIQRALQCVTEHIPSEVVGAYVAALAVLAPHRSDRLDEVTLFLVMCVATLVITWAAMAAELKQYGVGAPLSPARWPLRRMTSGLVAFVVWASVLPDSVMLAFSWFSPKLGVVALILLSAIYLAFDRVWARPQAQKRPPRGGSARPSQGAQAKN